jgi:site-specific DNA-methyltransferase (adenine-specific)
MTYEILEGDCRDFLPLPEPVDAVVTDPPYGLSFMGKVWDRGVPGVEFWESIGSAMKPGAHLLAFGGTRTFHRLTCAIEDAGFEIRDCLMWVYGSGFPKSLDVSKAIDKAAGAERGDAGPSTRHGGGVVGAGTSYELPPEPHRLTAPATDAAKQWQGWGTALKPAWEPIILARKPLIGTVAANVLEHGTGALNIDGCRVGTEKRTNPAAGNKPGGAAFMGKGMPEGVSPTEAVGRWPANLIHDGSDEVTEQLPNEAARFFYCAKASKAERGEGNTHPTVKPLALMRYLCRLVTPPGGLVLDPFMGSGSTLLAAQQEGLRSVGIDLDEKHCQIALNRLTRDKYPTLG